MLAFESTVNVFSPWNQMADALSIAASIFAVTEFACSSVPAVLLFPQAVNAEPMISGSATIDNLAMDAAIFNLILNNVDVEKNVFLKFMINSPICCLSAEKVAGSIDRPGRFFCMRLRA